MIGWNAYLCWNRKVIHQIKSVTMHKDCVWIEPYWAHRVIGGRFRRMCGWIFLLSTRFRRHNTTFRCGETCPPNTSQYHWENWYYVNANLDWIPLYCMKQDYFSIFLINPWCIVRKARFLVTKSETARQRGALFLWDRMCCTLDSKADAIKSFLISEARCINVSSAF